jgi:hypothetical protein
MDTGLVFFFNAATQVTLRRRRAGAKRGVDWGNTGKRVSHGDQERALGTVVVSSLGPYPNMDQATGIDGIGSVRPLELRRAYSIDRVVQIGP